MTNEQVVELLAQLARIANSLERLAVPWCDGVAAEEATPAVVGAVLDLVKVGQDLAQASALANRINAFAHGTREMIEDADGVVLECL